MRSAGREKKKKRGFVVPHPGGEDGRKKK